jgi:acyl-CoA synthetase (AMP-forming)/AMP-acid ligase II
LRWILSSADRLPAALAAEFERVTGVAIIDYYASTETGCVAAQLLSRSDRVAGSVGRPLSSCEIGILDEGGRPARPGKSGEICVRGACLMAGYYQRPDLTVQAIRDGWYRTGDRGRLDQEDNLFFEGRIREMIATLQGKVIPKDVEDVLQRHPAVRESATVGRRDGLTGERVVSYVVLQAGAIISADDLIVHCKRHLADFKCPGQVVFLEALPRNRRGKIVKDRLPPCGPSGGCVG